MLPFSFHLECPMPCTICSLYLKPQEVFELGVQLSNVPLLYHSRRVRSYVGLFVSGLIFPWTCLMFFRTPEMQSTREALPGRLSVRPRRERANGKCVTLSCVCVTTFNSQDMNRAADRCLSVTRGVSGKPRIRGFALRWSNNPELSLRRQGDQCHSRFSLPSRV